jgi:1-acyl-sn-glycerol-3-phosphate acyltransferase
VDQQAGSIASDVKLHVFRAAIALLWAGVSTLVYGIITIVSSVISKRFARFIAKMWAVQVLQVAGIRISINGAERIDKNKKYVFVANHQSGIDIPLLIAGLPRFLSFIAKKELFFIPVFGWGMAAIGHIWIDRANARKARESISRAVRMIQNDDISLVIFPEGTRSETGEIGEFKKGSFTLPIEAGVDLVPIAIRGTRHVLPKKEMWVRSGTVYLDIGEPLSVANLTRNDKADIAEKVRTVIAEMLRNGC